MDPRGWGEILFITRGDAVQHLVGEIEDANRGCAGQVAEKFELGSVEKRTARERIHLLQARGFLAWAELKDGLQKESIRTGGEMLQCGRRIAAVG